MDPARCAHRLLPFDGTNVADAGLARLAEMTSVEERGAGDLAVTRAGVSSLRGNRGMGMLLGRGSAITDEDLSLLEAAFPGAEIVAGSGKLSAPRDRHGK